MSNSFYTHGSFPSTGSAATSAAMRAELDLVTAGFDKLPTLAGNANTLIAVNASASALTAVSPAAFVLGVSDTNFTIQNSADSTKKFQFLASGITAGSTRIYTMPDSDQTLVGTTTTDTLTNKTLTSPTIATILNTGTLTLPTSTDTLVGRATTDTLTNKTLTSPTIATIVNSGTLTLPTSTDTLVGRATTDTLTNKTLTTPVISSISNSGTITLPTGTRTLVARDTTDTLTNKTLTTPIISSISNTGTLTLPTSTDTLVGRATTDTLTNKTLTTPIISSISNTGTLTLPTSTDTLVGRATTDTLTNKSISGATNTLSNIANASLTNSSVTVGTTAISLGGTSLTLGGLTSVAVTADPTLALQLATKQYVDTQVTTGLSFHDPVQASTTGTLASITGGTVTYANGTAGVGATLTLSVALSTLDGYTLLNTNRILVKDEVAGANNGVYTWATGGTVLTRATDADTYGTGAGDIRQNAYFFTQNGTVNKGNSYVITTTGTITFGTTSITFAQFSGSQTYTASTGLTLTGTAFSIDSTVATLTGAQTLTNKTMTGAALNGTIGATTASTGAFTTLSASSTVSGTGFSTYLASPPAIGGTAAAAGAFTTLSATGNTTLGDAVTDTMTFNGQFVTGTVLRSAQTATNTLALAAYDTDGAAYTDLITLTASTTPTLTLTSTGVGTINNMSVGATTASTGAFTTLSASSTVSGTGFSTYLASPPAIGGTAAAAGAFTTLSASSTVSGTGFSTYLASPPAIGGTAAAAGAFTTLSASSTVSGAGFSTYLASPPAIGGTAAAAGTFTTLTATGAVALSPANLNVVLSPTGTGVVTINPAAAGTINRMSIGATTASTGAFTTLSASSTVSGTGFSTYLASPPAIGGTTAAAGSFTTLNVNNTTRSGAALTVTAPAGLYSPVVTYTDNTTAASGTAAFGTINSIGATTIAASNVTVTYTVAASLYIASGPTAGTNVTINKSYSLYSTGTNYFLNSNTGTPGTISISAIHVGNNLSVGNGARIALGYVAPTGTFAPASVEFVQGATSGSGSGQLLFNLRDVTTDTAPITRLRIVENGTVALAGNPQANNGALGITSGAVLSIGANTITDTTTAASGTVSHGAVSFIGTPTIAATNTAVTYTNASTLYIAEAPTAGTNVTITRKYGLWSQAYNNYVTGLIVGDLTSNLNASNLYDTGVGSKIVIQAGPLNLNGTFKGSNVIINLLPSNGPTYKGGIAWGYVNGTTNTNAWAAIQVESVTNVGNGYGNMTFMTRNVTTDTTPTTRLTITADGNALFTNAFDKIFSITASVASSALTVTLNPCALDFRSATLTSGTVNTRAVASAISVVVPSTATLGTVNATQSRIAVIAIDNAGTVELAVVNIAGGNNLDETTLVSTTAISATADSNNVVYSTTARTSLPYRVVGYVESTQATAGTWATAPSTIQGAGGNAVRSMSSLGYGQTWQSVTRTSGTTYYNTTGKPIMVNAYDSYSGNLTGYQTLTIVVSGVTVATNRMYLATEVSSCFVSAIVPPGASYVVTISGSYNALAVFELR